jgi:hypothetical protein
LINLHGSSLPSPNSVLLSTVYGTRTATHPTTHLRRVFPHQPHPFHLHLSKVVTPETSQVDTSPLKAVAYPNAIQQERKVKITQQPHHQRRRTKAGSSSLANLPWIKSLITSPPSLCGGKKDTTSCLQNLLRYMLVTDDTSQPLRSWLKLAALYPGVKNRRG